MKNLSGFNFLLELLCAEINFFDTLPLFRPKFQGVPFGVVSGFAESEHPRLSNREIIFKEFQPLWSQIHQHYRREDG